MDTLRVKKNQSLPIVRKPSAGLYLYKIDTCVSSNATREVWTFKFFSH